MRAWYELAVWLHILSAAVWVGGIAFLVLIVVPWLRRGDTRQAAALLSATGHRFRTIAWICFGVFVVTGSFCLWVRGVRADNFVQIDWLRTPFGSVVVLKLGLFAVIVLISLVHDFLIGPMATKAMEQDPKSNRTHRLRRTATALGRINATLALIIVFVGVMLVRGVPF